MTIRIALFVLLPALFRGCQEFELVHRVEVKARDEKPQDSIQVLNDDQVGTFVRLKNGGMVLKSEYHFEKKHQNRVAYVTCSGMIRSSQPLTRSAIALAAYNEKGEQTGWRAIPLRVWAERPGKWSTFRDSLDLPEQFNWQPIGKIVFFAMLDDSVRETFDVSDLTYRVIVKK